MIFTGRLNLLRILNGGRTPRFFLREQVFTRQFCALTAIRTVSKSNILYRQYPIGSIFVVFRCSLSSLNKLSPVFIRKPLSDTLCINYSRTMSGISNGNTFQRLPQTVMPVNYDLTFEPDWTKHAFDATALIEVEVKEKTDTVILNAYNFIINEVKYKAASGEELEAEIFILDLEHELLKITFAKPLSTGAGLLTIDYSGKVADNLKGLFRSKYQGANGEEKFHYLTKFEPTYARACYPCWDEPAIKTTYDITLIVPKHLVAVSNMPVKEDTPHPTNIDKRIVKFERSVKMSTYVMAFAMGEFDYVENTSPDGILCRVYTPIGKKERGNFALEVVMKSLSYYKNYFGIPYPLPKMDLLAVTEFGSGAMENWGLVIFREQNLLMDEKLSSTITKQLVAIVVAHETAHMWFGNLVTMEWWSDLWLNEGYATFMEFLCVDEIYPELQIWNLYMDQYINALEMDASATSHPIQATVGNPSEIGSIFDAISYYKGASIIRMIHNYLGDAKFREGMSHYLNQHLFANAETKDLWAALKEKSKEDIDVIMPTYTEQMGYPVFTVKSIEQVGNMKNITLSYEKFWADSKAKAKDTKKYRWITPFTARTQSDPTGISFKTLINEDPNVDIKLSVNSNEGEWVKLNTDHVGYYRVTYPSSVLKDYVPSIQKKELQQLDRLGILNDLFANVKAGYSSSEDLLTFMLAYKEEDNFSVWSCILNIISTYNKLLRGTPLHGNFKNFALSLTESIATKLGWDKKENEKAQDSALRAIIISRLVGLGSSDTIQEAKNRFALHVRGDKLVAPDVRSAVYRAVASEGEAGFEALLKVYRSSDLLEEKVRILAALGAVNDKAVIQKILEFARSDEVNMQDISTVLVSLSDQGKEDISWQYFQNHWEFFRDRFPTGHFIIRRVVSGVTSDFKTEEKVVEIQKFFQDHPIKGIDRTLSQSYENIRINKAWLERDSSALQQFLSSY